MAEKKIQEVTIKLPLWIQGVFVLMGLASVSVIGLFAILFLGSTGMVD